MHWVCVEWNWNIYQTGYSHLGSAAAVRNRLWQQEPYNVAGCEIAYAKSSPIVVVWKIFWPYFLSSSKRDISVLNAKLFPYLEEKRSPFVEKENIFLRFKNPWKRTPFFPWSFFLLIKLPSQFFLWNLDFEYNIKRNCSIFLIICGRIFSPYFPSLPVLPCSQWEIKTC